MTQAWHEYQSGIDYKTKINLYRTVDVNERFYAGDHWAGIPHDNLPTPVLNAAKYASGWKISAVSERRIKLLVTALRRKEVDGVNVADALSNQISQQLERLWERLKMDYVKLEVLKQAAITGDGLLYFYWDAGIQTGQSHKGDINLQIVDNVNYYPSNPNDPDVQAQEYIILASREPVKKVRDRATEEEKKLIVADDDYAYTAGDRGKIELDSDKDTGKCTVLVKMWKQDGVVWFEKSTQAVVIEPAKATQLKRYPVALINWETRKNSCHGVAEMTAFVNMQVYINKMLALQQLSQALMAAPKVIYDKTRIQGWSNRVGAAIGVNGDIRDVATYLTPPATNYDIYAGLQATVDLTLKIAGANEAALGNIKNPDNTSAIIATRDAALVPLQAQQDRFYNFIEDTGLIWIDFISGYYTNGREVEIDIPARNEDGMEIPATKAYVKLTKEEMDGIVFDLKLDVGPANWLSEMQQIQTLDNLLRSERILFSEYLEAMPQGQIPNKEKILVRVKDEEERMRQQQEMQEMQMQAQQMIQPPLEMATPAM